MFLFGLQITEAFNGKYVCLTPAPGRKGATTQPGRRCPYGSPLSYSLSPQLLISWRASACTLPSMLQPSSPTTALTYFNIYWIHEFTWRTAVFSSAINPKISSYEVQTVLEQDIDWCDSVAKRTTAWRRLDGRAHIRLIQWRNWRWIITEFRGASRTFPNSMYMTDDRLIWWNVWQACLSFKILLLV